MQSIPTDELSTLLVVAALQAAGHRTIVYPGTPPPGSLGSGSQAQCMYDFFDFLRLRLSPRHAELLSPISKPFPGSFCVHRSCQVVRQP